VTVHIRELLYSAVVEVVSWLGRTNFGQDSHVESSFITVTAGLAGWAKGTSVGF
jgi:hypothetical protein